VIILPEIITTYLSLITFVIKRIALLKAGRFPSATQDLS
jgi:hypothetical protein